jgi:hypothetical protein
MTDPTQHRLRHSQSKGTIVALVTLFGLAALGIISTAILITLIWTQPDGIPSEPWKGKQ